MNVIIDGIEYVPKQQNEETNATFGELIKSRRKALKKTLFELANECGVSKSYLYEIEHNNPKSVSLKIAYLLSVSLGIDLETLAQATMKGYE